MTEYDGGARLEASAYPLIVFVHVPKTAGSTIKKLLTLCTPGGDINVQFLMDDRDAFLDIARNSHWIGGHCRRDRFAKRLTWLNRPIEYFSCVREPVAQLRSHLNFSFHRLTDGNYYGLHNLDEQRLDAEVTSTDFSNPSAVMLLLLRHARHYLNAQSRYILGLDFAEISDDEIALRLATYTFVASETKLPQIYRAFGFARLPHGVNEFRENTAKYEIDAQVFNSPQMREFLTEHHRHDLRLYAPVQATVWPAEARRPFRAAFLEKEAFTAENFEERSYLESNLDVAAEVKHGRVKSGRDHFENFGHMENRMMRRWVFPQTRVSESLSTPGNFCIYTAIERLRGFRDDRAQIARRRQTPIKQDW